MTAGVSVLLPSRRRPELLEKAITSLMLTAQRPEQVEVLVAADPDDPATPGLTVPERWGRGSLHKYYNWLATHASGRWLLIFNDDATMETEGWDEIIAGQEPCIGCVGSNHGDHMFIAVPAAWAKAAGYLATTPDIDNFLYDVGGRLGHIRSLPVRVFHDVHYVTGRNGDSTYWEGRADAERAAAADQADWDRVSAGREQAVQRMTRAIRELVP